VSAYVGAQPTRAVPFPGTILARNIDNTNGLLSNAVLAITRDRQGYVWIGTEKGLQRYDGMRLVDCVDPAARPQSLNVKALFPDERHGRLLYQLPPDGPVMEWKMMEHVAAPLGQATGRRMEYAGKDGKGRWTLRVLWTDSSKAEVRGLATMQEPGKDKELQAHFITEKDGRHTWLVVNEKGLMLLDERQKTVLPLPFTLDPLSIHKIDLDGRGNLWLASWTTAFYRYYLPGQKLFQYSLADILKQEGNDASLPVWIDGLLEDDHGVMWFGTGQAGLLRWDRVNDQFEYLLRQPGNSQGLQYTDQINTLFQDKESNIWVGTDKGISVLNPYGQYFRTLSNQDSSRPSMVMSDIVPVQLIRDELWVGSWGQGIKVYDTAWRLKRKYFFPGEYDLNMVWCLLPRRDGSVWVGCQGGVLYIIDAAGRVIRTLKPPEANGRTIKDMTEDKEGNVLLGLHSGRILVNRKEKFLPYNDSMQPKDYIRSPVENLYVDEDNVCWASTFHGLAEFDVGTGRFKGLYQPHPGVNVRCWGVSAYQDSLLLVGTENDGLYLFDRKRHRFTPIPVNVEQSHWSVHAVTVDAQGSIWFSTDHTLCHYDPVSGKSFVIQPPRNLVTSDFTGRTFRVGPGGEWITWTTTEVVGFYPAFLQGLERRRTDVVITGFRVFSTPLYIDSLLEKNLSVQLESKQNFIAIDFSNLQFSGVERTNYLYRLDQVDTGWVHGGANATAAYTKLAPGKYVFRVKTENALGDAGMAVLRFEIATPFWATGWFRVLVLAIVLFGVFLLLRRHDRRVREEANIKQRIARTEMMALRAQMNPHFIFNCINGIDALIQSDDKYRATMYLNRFARLIRNVLDSSNHDTISLARDLETLQLYIDLEKFRAQDRFTANIVVQDGLLDEDCRVPPLIVQPYVENAIHHGLRGLPGKEGRLTIEVRREAEYLVYRIEDNGVGRAAAASNGHRRSYGMEISRDRVELFNGEERAPVVITDLEVDGRPAGTRVEVSLIMNA